MLARLVRFSIVLELVLYAALGAWLHFVHGWGPAGIVAAVLALALGARLGLVGFTSLVGWLNRGERDPAHRIGWSGAVRYLVGEYAALVADSLWLLPFDALAVRADPPLAAAARPPVILVHGYLSNRGYFRGLVAALERAGVRPVFTPNFRVLFSSIEHYAGELHAQIERICAGCGQERVALVCYSMGGLAAREYLRRHGERRVAKLITIASPHHGTVLASMGLGLNARQMHRGSELLRELERAEAAAPPRIDAASIWSPHDNLVAPPETSVLAWARSIPLPGVGHVSIVTSPRTFAAVVAELAA
jgi:triacylglycerol esterase/lipase EstA (alpha/beta hydrolase family)